MYVRVFGADLLTVHVQLNTTQEPAEAVTAQPSTQAIPPGQQPPA
jgi:hypothetical protein